MLGNIGDLFVKCFFFFFLNVCDKSDIPSDSYVMYRQRAKSVYETSAKVTNWLTDPLRWFCELL